MSARTSPLLGGDPVPGDSAAVRQLIGRLRGAVGSISAAATLVRSIGTDPGMWHGQAADAFRARQGDLLDRLAAAETAYDRAAGALTRWVTRLEHDQAEAVRLVVRANSLTPNPDGSPNPALHALRAAHDRLAAQARAAAQNCATDLHAAVGPVRRFQHSGWDHLVESVLSANNVLEKVSGALGLAALATAWIPGVGEVIGGLALATGALLVVSDVFLVTQGKKGVGTTLVDIGGLALGGAGGVAGRVFTTAKQAERFEKAAAGARGDAALFTRLGAADRSWSAAAHDVTFDTLHPVKAWQLSIVEQNYTTQPMLRMADRYNGMPTLQHWLPTEGAQWAPFLVRTADQVNTIRESQ